MTKANDLASLLDANGDVVSSALDNVPASDLVNDTTPQLGGNLDLNSNNITGTGNLDVTGTVNISNSSGATLKLRSTDTTGADTELLGQIDFVSSDSSGGSAGTQARIKGVYEDNGDSSGIAFLTGNSTGSGSPTINEVMRIRHEGRVGIGTSSVTSGFKLEVTGDARFGDVYNDDAVELGWSSGGSQGFVQAYDRGASAFRDLSLNNAMTLSSAGNVLVGKTTLEYSSNTGHVLRNDGLLSAVRSGGNVVNFNRLSSDGEIIQLNKDGTRIGSIGVDNTDNLTISGNSSHCGLNFSNNGINPYKNEAYTDGTTSLGSSSTRFDDIYATNGTIQTSDQNEKQQIAALTDAEMTAAKAISALFKTFKWNSAVETKGDAARTHTGVIAQDVEAAMTAAGLDAGDYAFFISSTWWETQTDVPAVEAVEAVLDEDGNVVTEAVEAKEAFTRIDIYETAEEAPEGATERTRMGIRYPELLAFIGAATEQRLANIETRLAALETA